MVIAPTSSTANPLPQFWAQTSQASAGQNGIFASTTMNPTTGANDAAASFGYQSTSASGLQAGTAPWNSFGPGHPQMGMLASDADSIATLPTTFNHQPIHVSILPLMVVCRHRRPFMVTISQLMDQEAAHMLLLGLTSTPTSKDVFLGNERAFLYSCLSL